MPKLLIHVKEEFETENLQVRRDGVDQDQKGKKALKLFRSIDTKKIGVEVVSTNKDAEASFVFNRSGMKKKGAICEIDIRDDGNGLSCSIDATFEVTLRSGVAPLLKKPGKKLDLRLRGVTGNDGVWSGFFARVAGGDFEQTARNWKTTFPKIREFSIK